MAGLKLFLQFIIAFPKVISAMKEIGRMVDVINEKIKESRHDKALDELKGATDAEKQEDAFKDVVRNP